MLPKLSDRAATRCTSNIARFYPAWKQAELRQSGGEPLMEMEDFIERNKLHLTDLRQRIAEGEAPCIDTGWPSLDAEPVEPKPEPEVIEKVVEVEKIVEVPVEVEVIKEVPVKDTEAEQRLEHVLKDLERLKADHEARKPAPDADTEPPAEVADLFDPNLTARQNQEKLTKRYTDLMNERQWWLEGGDDKSKAMELLRKAERIESGIKWNRARLAEVI